MRFSQLVVEQPWIKEIDINPLLASPERIVALDARVVVHGLDMTEDKLPTTRHSSLSDSPGQPMDNEGREGRGDQAYPAGRRAHDD